MWFCILSLPEQEVTSWLVPPALKGKKPDFNHLLGKRRISYILFSFVCIWPKYYSCIMCYLIFCRVNQELAHLQWLKEKLFCARRCRNKGITHPKLSRTVTSMWAGACITKSFLLFISTTECNFSWVSEESTLS